MLGLVGSQVFVGGWGFYRRFVLDNPWVPKRRDPVTGLLGPSVKQAEFLLRVELEGLFGGATGGGKSWSLLAAAARFVVLPNYHAVIFRRHLTDHKLAGGLIAKSLEWWGHSKARWNAVDFKWSFPAENTDLQFGFLEAESDRQRWASTAFQFMGWDELTQFPEDDYLFMLSRLRREAGNPIPLQVRCATNPGDIGHEWVKRRFIAEKHVDRFFIPATLEDNNFIDKASYEKNLLLLDYVTRMRLRYADWDIAAQGNKFKYAWFINGNAALGPPRNQVVDEASNGLRRFVRFWDKAATEAERGKDPDWTAGVKMGELDGRFYVVDVQRFRGTPAENERRIKDVAELDGAGTTQYIEQAKGGAGKDDVDHYTRDVLKGLPSLGSKITGDKEMRANPFSTACENGLVYLLHGGWNVDFINELCQFPKGSHDDQVDAASGAFSKLKTVGERGVFS